MQSERASRMLPPHTYASTPLYAYWAFCYYQRTVPVPNTKPSIWAFAASPATSNLYPYSNSFPDRQFPLFPGSFLWAYKHAGIFFIIRSTLSWPYIPLELPLHFSAYFYNIRPKTSRSLVFLPFHLELVQTGYASTAQPKPLVKITRSSSTALNPRVRFQATFSLCKGENTCITVKCFFINVKGYHYYLETSKHLKLMNAHCCKDTSILPILSPPPAYPWSFSSLSGVAFHPCVSAPIYILDIECVCVCARLRARARSMLFQREHLTKRRSFPTTLLFLNSSGFTTPSLERHRLHVWALRAPSALGASQESPLWWGQGPGALPCPLSQGSPLCEFKSAWFKWAHRNDHSHTSRCY